MKKNRKIFRKLIMGFVGTVIVSFFSLQTMNYKYNNTSLENYTTEDVGKILKQVIDKSRYHPDKEIYLDTPEAGMVNAWVSEDASAVYVVVTREFLKFTKTKDELAFVLGHEWAHVSLRHTSYGFTYMFDNNFYFMYKEPVQMEYLSDLVGQQYARLAGYDYTQAGVTFYRLGKLYGEGGGYTHPTNTDRTTYLSFNRSVRAYLHLVVFPKIEQFNEKVFNLIPY